MDTWTPGFTNSGPLDPWTPGSADWPCGGSSSIWTDKLLGDPGAPPSGVTSGEDPAERRSGEEPSGDFHLLPNGLLDNMPAEAPVIAGAEAGCNSGIPTEAPVIAGAEARCDSGIPTEAPVIAGAEARCDSGILDNMPTEALVIDAGAEP